MAEPLKSPYRKGTTLTLEIRRAGSRNVLPQLRGGRGKELQVKILDVIEPSTMSVVLKVALEQQKEDEEEGETAEEENTAPAPQVMILKMHDRQFSSQVRQFEEAGPATSANEAEFIDFVRKGSMTAFLKHLAENETEASREWDIARREAYFSYRTSQSHEMELEIYDRLVDLQGLCVPTMFADVRLAPQSAAATAAVTADEESLAEYTHVRGILMECIAGFPLHEVVTSTPESDWAPICDQAIEAIRKISDRDFINFDIKTRNILVRRAEPPASPSYQVFFIDFGECKLRDPSDSDEAWRELKRQKDEEGAVGYVMTTHMLYAKGKKGRKYKGPDPLPWVYTPSSRFEGQESESGHGDGDG
ncbi:hypothetical protein E4U43_005278 [Claviceps pusilla]|uniref:Protein kinase domain-containing protein n=1 Tax=Claviceps pusilla TaxID=123648 RepID=A0A9P7T1K6_9HYPO|nr:hypothetical protein E4U43_005278 [Claviceps pusilla]